MLSHSRITDDVRAADCTSNAVLFVAAPSSNSVVAGVSFLISVAVSGVVYYTAICDRPAGFAARCSTVIELLPTACDILRHVTESLESFGASAAPISAGPVVGRFVYLVRKGAGRRTELV